MRKENLPQEIDELIWLTAESNDESAIKDFEERYPQYRAELATRRVMIEVMRKSKPQSIPMHLENPRMHLNKSRNSWFRWAFVPVSVIMLTVLAFGAYILNLQFSKEEDILNNEKDNFILESLPNNKNNMNPIIVPGNSLPRPGDEAGRAVNNALFVEAELIEIVVAPGHRIGRNRPARHLVLGVARRAEIRLLSVSGRRPDGA